MKRGTTLSLWNKNSDSNISSVSYLPSDENKCVKNGTIDVTSNSHQKRIHANCAKTNKSKMPAFLRLDSAGEDTSSYMINKGHENTSVPLIKSGALHSQSDTTIRSKSSNKSSPTKAYFSWSPSNMMAATNKLFSPNYHSTPNMKSKSFPDVTHLQKQDNPGSLCKRKEFSNSKSAHLFLNSSVPVPQCISGMAENHRLRESSSTPTLLMKNCYSPADQFFFKPSGTGYSPSGMDQMGTCISRVSCGALPNCIDGELSYGGEESEQCNENGICASSSQNSHVPFSSPIMVPQSDSSQNRGQEMENGCEKTEHKVFKKDASSSPEVVNNCDKELITKSENSPCSVQKENDSDSSKPASSAEVEAQDSDRSFVLFRERKRIKKGRPSTKKQNKRKREKLKQSETSSVDDSSFLHSDSSHRVGGNSQEKQLLRSPLLSDDSITFDHNSHDHHSDDHYTDTDVSFSSAQEVNHIATSPKPNTSGHSSSQTYKTDVISGFQDSEDDSESDNDSENSDSDSDSEGSWCNDEMEKSLSAIGLGLALSIDAIFKQKELPSLRSVMQECTGELPNSFSTSSPKSMLTVYVGSPDNSSLEDSIQFSSMPESDCEDHPSSPLAQSAFDQLNGFSQGLCMDTIFSRLIPPAATQCAKQASVKCATPESHLDHDLLEVNAKWDKHYQSAGFRSCSSTSPVKNPAVKVCFADDSRLVTIHEVGTEERKGTWQNFAIDRERFNRRIQEVSQVLSPVLDQAHREKVFNRNSYLSETLQLGLDQ